jgi:hypothetical protein
VKNNKAERSFRLSIISISVLFGLWAFLFIRLTSCIAIDGQRYFALFDDAMVSMRYAWNLSHGYGLVWNPGEQIEGYTNLLLILGMSVFTLLLEKRMAVLAIQIIGALLVLGIGWQSVIISRHFTCRAARDGRLFLEILLFAAVIFHYPLAYWSLMGMETGLLTLLLLLAVGCYFKYTKENRDKALYLMSIFCGLACLTRPDALIFALILFFFIFIELVIKSLLWKRLGFFILALALFLVFPFAQVVFRWFYYGELVPNTYLLKMTGFPILLRIGNGLAFIRVYAIEYSPLFLIASIGIICGFSRERLLLISMSLASIFYTIWIGGDAWYYWRLLAPPHPLVLILFGVGMITILDELPSSGRGKRYFTMNRLRERLRQSRMLTHLRSKRGLSLPIFLCGLIFIILAIAVDWSGLRSSGLRMSGRILLLFGIVLILSAIYRGLTFALRLKPVRKTLIVFPMLFISVFLMTNFHFLQEIIFLRRPFNAALHEMNINAAVALLDLTDEEASVGVTWAGLIPYYTGRYAVDFLGKSDRTIASLPADISGDVSHGDMFSWPGHNKYDLHYSIGILRPTYVQTFQWGSQDLTDLLISDYVSIQYQGVPLYLMRNSPYVDWGRITIDE